MSINIYLFKTHRINLLEIAGVQILKNSPERFFPICQYDLDHKFLRINQTGRMVNDLATKSCELTNFRKVSWQQYKDYLDQCVLDATKNKQNIMFGTQRQDQIDYLVGQYPEIVKTLEVTYSTDSYDFLLENVAEYHVHLLSSGQLEMNEQDREKFMTLSPQDLVSFYKKSFDDVGLIPREVASNATYTIDVRQLFDLVYFSNWLENLGFPFTTQGLDFYRKWAELNQP